jgi:hypothetical protein
MKTKNNDNVIPVSDIIYRGNGCKAPYIHYLNAR